MKANDDRPIHFLRFQSGGYTGFGCLRGDKIFPIVGSIFGKFDMGNRDHSLDEITFLPPVVPQKIICVGLNYAGHAAESTLDRIPEEPVLFFKPPSALIGHGDRIVLPEWVDRVDYEGELAVIIGQRLKNVGPEAAGDGIFGCTCLNDVTARNIQKKDSQWTRAKGFDTFCPVGPYIVKGFDYSSLDIETRLNGKIMQKSNTSLMLRTPAEVVSFISKVMTLCPGDIVSMGTPSGVGPLKAGDVVEIEVEGIGILSNPVIAE